MVNSSYTLILLDGTPVGCVEKITLSACSEHTVWTATYTTKNGSLTHAINKFEIEPVEQGGRLIIHLGAILEE